MKSNSLFSTLFIIFCFITTSAFAGDVVELTRNSNVRSSRNFYGRSNVLGLIPAGSMVEILESTKLPSGANALKIKILKPEDKTYLNEKAPLYIWQSGVNVPKAVTDTEAGTTCTDGSCPGANATADAVKDIKEINQKIEEQESEAPATDLENAVKKYSESEQVKKTIDWAIDKNNGKQSQGWCYRKVKEALANRTKSGKGEGNNLIPKWFSSAAAKDATKDLKKYGFVNLLERSPYRESMTDPKQAPKGAVLVYQTDLHNYGHIEIKLDDGETSRYAADYINTHSIMAQKSNGKHYKLIGVMIKPEVKD